MVMAYSLPVGGPNLMLSISAEIIEPVASIRQPQVPFFGRTWGGNPLLTSIARPTAFSDVEQSLLELFEMFANDFLAANQKAQM
jgi:hypothetical protein